MVHSVDSILREEYETMGEIERVIELAAAHLREENRLHVSPDEKTLAAQREVQQISNNVQRALGLQRTLLIHCEKLRKLFITLLQESIELHQFKRYNLEEEILQPMEKLSLNLPALNKLRRQLLVPLFLPDFYRNLNLSLVYERQAKIKEMSEVEIIEEYDTSPDHQRLERIKKRNESHVRIISLLLEFAKTHSPRFLFTDFWDFIKIHKSFSDVIAENLLFLDMLKLYEIREIDIDKFRKENEGVAECMGEFDLAYCLARSLDRNSPIKSLSIDKSGEEHVCCHINDKESIYIDNLLFEVNLL